MHTHSLHEVAASRRREEGLLAVVILAIFAVTAVVASRLESMHRKTTCAALAGQLEQFEAAEAAPATAPPISLRVPNQHNRGDKESPKEDLP